MRGKSAPCFRNFKISRGQSGRLPKDSEAPLRDNAEVSASRAKAGALPQLLAIPTGKSAAQRTTPKCPAPNLNRARAGTAAARGTPLRSNHLSRCSNYLEQTKQAVAPASKTTTLSVSETKNRPPRNKVAENNCSQVRPCTPFRGRPIRQFTWRRKLPCRLESENDAHLLSRICTPTDGDGI